MHSCANLTVWIQLEGYQEHGMTYMKLQNYRHLHTQKKVHLLASWMCTCIIIRHVSMYIVQCYCHSVYTFRYLRHSLEYGAQSKWEWANVYARLKRWREYQTMPNLLPLLLSLFVIVIIVIIAIVTSSNVYSNNLIYCSGYCQHNWSY